MLALKIILAVISVLLMIHPAYFVIIALHGFRKPVKIKESSEKKKFCAVVAARNEEKVISKLLESLKNQNYPKDKFDICVVVNNCTDNTKVIAENEQVNIFQCSDKVNCKGQALKEFFDSGVTDSYDAFCIFDADNVVDKNFISKMNDAYMSGATVAQGYREAKNSKDSYTTGCYSIFFWLLNRFMIYPRSLMGTTVYLVGTGWMVRSENIKKYGFETTTMTEDLEYMLQSVLNDQEIMYVPEAKTYDEYTKNIKTSWNQKRRWSTGMLQSCIKYIKQLMKKAIHEKDKNAFDVAAYIFTPCLQPLVILSILISVVLFIDGMIYSPFSIFFFAVPLLCGFVVTIAVSILVIKLEGHKLSDIKFVSYVFLWVFLLAWVPVTFLSIVKPVKEWKHIEHVKSIDISEIDN